jgi:hypothetical protein
LGACEADSTATPADCEGLASDLEAEIYTGAQGCTAVVRLAFDTYAPTDWVLRCGPYTEVDEAQASTTAKADLEYGADLADQAPGSTLNPPDPSDAYVFQVPPMDLGGFAVVSAHTGLALLGGRLTWSAPASVLYPSEWRDPTLLGVDCGTSISLPTPRVYDFAADSLSATSADIQRVYAAVEQTVVPTAFASNGLVTDVVLVRLQRTVDGSNRTQSTSQWVVLLSGGAPE